MAKDVKVAILGDASSFKKAVADAKGSADDAEGHFAKVGEGIKKIGAAMAIGVAAAGVAGVAFAKSAISAASDLNESLGKSSVVFGDNAKDIEAWASKSAKAFGQSKQQALEAVGTYGNLFQAFGVGKQESAKMSKSLVELAADLASFNNTSVDDALQALQSGLSGETEPLKKFGVAINDDRLKAEALRLGLIKTTKEALTPGAKAQAAYALVMKDTALAQGDFARTSDGLANKQRILSAQFTDLKANIGSALLPVFLTVVSFISDNMIPAFNWIKNAIDTVIGGFQNADAEIGGSVSKMEAFLLRLGATFSKVFDAIKTAISVTVDWLTNTAWPAIQAGFEVVKGWLEDLKAGWDSRWEDIKAATENIITAIKVVIGAVLAAIIFLWRAWGDDLKHIVQGLMDAIKGIIDVVLGLLSGDWGRAWDGLKSIVSGAIDAIKALLGGLASTIGELGGYMWEGLKTGFRAVINWIIDKWNGLEFKVPGFSAFGAEIGGFTIGVPDIPRLAQGGIAMAPTLAVVGDNGGRGEAVIPLDKLEQMMGNGAGGEFHFYLDGRELSATLRRINRRAA